MANENNPTQTNREDPKPVLDDDRKPGQNTAPAQADKKEPSPAQK